jgi:peptidoglycan/LPS O-acetylase OafA/YrhL
MVLGRHVAWIPVWQRAGWAGVDLFFVLSGYLISGLLFSEWMEHRSINIGRFYIRRGFKIYPAFFVLVAITLAGSLLRHRAISPRAVLAEVFFVQDYFSGLFNHTWSLGVEEHFYLLLPLLLWIMQRTARMRDDPFRNMPFVFGVTAVACLTCRLSAGSRLTGEQWYTYLYPTHLRVDSLMCGVALSYWRHFRPLTFQRIQRSKVGWVLVAVAVAALATVPLTDPRMHTIGFSLLFAAFAWLVARIVDYTPGPRAGVIVIPLAGLGFYSYSIYLWHMWISYRMDAFPALPPWLHFWIYVGSACAWGVLAARLIEAPALRIRNTYFPSASLNRGALTEIAKHAA